MKLYRFSGSVELWANTGPLPMDPLVSTNLTQLKKDITQLIRKWNKAKLRYAVRLDTIYLKKFSTAVATEVLASEDVDLLIEKRTKLKEWKNEPA